MLAPREREEWRRGRTGLEASLREEKSGVKRDGRRVASLAGGQTPVWRRGCTVEALETIVYSLNNFDSSLTH